MFAMVELAMLDFSTLAPEFALLFGAADVHALRRRLRVTVRMGRRAEVVVI